MFSLSRHVLGAGNLMTVCFYFLLLFTTRFKLLYLTTVPYYCTRSSIIITIHPLFRHRHSTCMPPLASAILTRFTTDRPQLPQRHPHQRPSRKQKQPSRRAGQGATHTPNQKVLKCNQHGQLCMNAMDDEHKGISLEETPKRHLIKRKAKKKTPPNKKLEHDSSPIPSRKAVCHISPCPVPRSPLHNLVGSTTRHL